MPEIHEDSLNQDKPTLALIDGNSIAYRAFFALPEELATTSGQQTNAVFGFTRMLIRLLTDHDPDGVVVAWDVSRRSFRTDEYPEYKAQRSSAPDAFRSQLPLIDEVLDALRITQLRQEGFEADDIIATLCRDAVKGGWKVLVVTGDRDAFQLVDDDVTVVYTRRGISDVVMATAEWIEDKYAIKPVDYVPYAALRGDNSDNLPGVTGVGEKRAAQLIIKYGTLDEIFAHLDEQTPKLRENLALAREQVLLNERLMTLVDDMDLDLDVDSLHLREWDPDVVEPLFDSLEFHSMWEDLLAVTDAAQREVTIMDVETFIDTRGVRLSELLTTAETVGIEPVLSDDEIWGFAVSDGEIAVAVPLEIALTGLADAAVAGHDIKETLRRLGSISFKKLAMDTALASYVINPTSREYELEGMAEKYLAVELVSPDREDDNTLFDMGPDTDTAGNRAAVVAHLSGVLREELANRSELELFEELELPLIPVLAQMEYWGIGIDVEYLEDLGEDLRQRLTELRNQIFETAGMEFNLNSTDQLREVLFGKLELPVTKKTSTGRPSTDASVLEKLEHPITEDLLRYRELEKLRSTYVEGYLPLVADDGRIHTRFNQMTAATGRLSSDRPNLQNIPIRSEEGRTIRRAFIADEGHLFLVADYSQIELRILAHLSRDPDLVEIFRSDGDVHTSTASRVWGVPESEVTGEMRRRSKMINFGLLYGMEAYGLASRLGITRDEAQEHMDTYFEQFPSVSDFLAGVVDEARRSGYTTTMFGRRRYLPELKSDNFRIRQMGERMALNAPVQGSAADIIKKAMIDLDHRVHETGSGARQLLQIHDELVLEVPESEIEDAKSLTVSTMEGVIELEVPLKVEPLIASNLAKAKE
ncbi:MAG: DNA polymerase I [Acidimicrobiia bacterium]|nr:DNA polymerase I [Acidimicrobiia bacterium]